jgi:transcriptional regulator with XRE-family HTH domain
MKIPTAELLKRKGDDGKTVATRLKGLRFDNKLTVEGFAERCGVPPSTARDWLNGKVLPSSEGLFAIAEAFGVTTDWILGRRGAPMHPEQYRTDAELAEDLGWYVAREAFLRLDPALSDLYNAEHVYVFLGGGRQVLKYLVDDVSAELTARIVASRSKSATTMEAVDTIAEMIGYRDAKEYREVAARLVSVLWKFESSLPMPTGRFIRATSEHDR